MGTAVHVVHESHCPDIGPICNERDEPPQLHDQMFYVTELRPILEYGLSEHFSVEVQIPFKVNHTTIVYRRLDGTVYEPDFANIHHRNETLFGLGDPWLSGRTAWKVGPFMLTGRLGLTLPLGSTEENPFVLGRAGLEHQHIQFGTGTFDPVLALEAAYPLGRYSLRAYAQAQLVLDESSKGYRAGNRYGMGALSEGPLVGALRGSVGLDVLTEQPERWDGRIEQDGNLGRTDVLVGVSLTYPLGPFRLTVGAKVPVYQHVIETGHEGGQLTYPAIVNVGLQRPFDLMSKTP